MIIIEVILSMIAGLAVGILVWKLMTGKWIPDGSFSASRSPSGIDWNKVNEILDQGGDLYERRNEIKKRDEAQH